MHRFACALKSLANALECGGAIKILICLLFLKRMRLYKASSELEDIFSPGKSETNLNSLDSSVSNWNSN